MCGISQMYFELVKMNDSKCYMSSPLAVVARAPLTTPWHRRYKMNIDYVIFFCINPLLGFVHSTLTINSSQYVIMLVIYSYSYVS